LLILVDSGESKKISIEVLSNSSTSEVCAPKREVKEKECDLDDIICDPSGCRAKPKYRKNTL